MGRPVYLAGRGVVCRMGGSPEAVWANVLQGEMPASLCDNPFSDGHKMACTAATQAWEAALALDLSVVPERVGLVASTSRGVFPEPVDGKLSRKDGLSRLVNSSGGAVSGAVARAIGHRGPTMMISANCVSSAVAVCMAADLIQCGVWDAALVGGVEQAAQSRVRDAFANAEVPVASEPGDSGVLLADGAGFVVLSADVGEHELLGWSHRIEPSDRCGIHGMSTASLCLDAALKKANLAHADLRSLHGHGNGNPRSDASEVDWLAMQSGLAGMEPFSWKRWTGHCLGASPVIELAMSCHAMDAADARNFPVVVAPPWGWYGFGLWGYAAALVVR